MKHKKKKPTFKITETDYIKAIRKADREIMPFFPSKRHKSPKDYKRLKGTHLILQAED